MSGVLAVTILIVLLIYEKWWRKIVCERKINQYIESIGGKILSIEKLSIREEIYTVYYIENDKNKRNVVKFSFFYEMTWG